MAILINGNGNKAIWAQQDADLIAALAGNVTGIAKVGNKFEATQEDANTIGLSDGVIVTKEGRRIQLDVGSVDLFDIPTGTAGVTSYYIIGYHLITNSDSSQTCETFVQKMDNATDVITENTFRGGASEVYVSCYRVVQDGLNIDSINALLPELENISTLMSNLSDFKFRNNNGIPEFSMDNGSTWNTLGGSSMKVLKYGTINSTTTISLDVTLDPSKYIVKLDTNKYQYRQDQIYAVAYAYGNGAYISAKTSTSCTINVDSGLTCSYEIIQIAD